MDSESTMNSAEVVLASGGLVMRQGSGGLEVAVIHRPKYGDWTLPKGKLEDGESWKEAAIREVGEETGIECKIEGFAGTTDYTNNGVRKVVLFWKMGPVGDCSFHPKDKDEVDQLLWLAPKMALKKLEHHEERNVMKEVTAGQKQPSGRSGRDSERSFLSSKRRDRFESDLSTHEVLLERRIRLCEERGNTSKVDKSWIEPARELTVRAREALENDNLMKGWKCLNAARQLETFGYDDSELEARAEVLLNEAEKLDGWRKKAIKGLCDTSATVVDVYKAAVIRDGHFDNTYFKIDLITFQRTFLLAILAAAVISILLIVGAEGFPETITGNHLNPSLLNVIAFLGAAGASFSAAQSLGKASAYISGAASPDGTQITVKIPEQIASTWISMTRPALGAAAALVVYFFILSDLSPFENIDNTFTVFIIAFASGFSERLINQAIWAVKLKKES